MYSTVLCFAILLHLFYVFHCIEQSNALVCMLILWFAFVKLKETTYLLTYIAITLDMLVLFMNRNVEHGLSMGTKIIGDLE